MQLKIARPEDQEACLKLLKEFYKEADMIYKGTFSEEKVNFLLENRIPNPKEWFICLAIEDEPIGIFVGCVTEFMFNEDLLASEIVWYMKPEHRRGLKALKLFKTFLYWAKHLAGAKFITSSMAKRNLQKTYERMGFTMVEQTYMKGL